MTIMISPSPRGDEGIEPEAPARASGSPTEPDYDEPAEPVEGDTAEVRATIDEHLRRIRWWEIELQKSADLYQAQRTKLDEESRALEAWSRREHVRVGQRIAWHADVVRGYLAARIRHDAKLRTVSLPHGRLIATVPKTPRLIVTDQGALDAWVNAEHPELWGDPKPPSRIGVTKLAPVARVVGMGAGGYMVVDDGTGEVIPGLVAELAEPRLDYDTTPDELF